MPAGIVPTGALLLTALVTCQPAPAPPSDQESVTVPYWEYLETMCGKLDCHATVERAVDKDIEQWSPLVEAVVVDEEVESVEELVKKLDEEIEGVDVSLGRSGGFPVVHLAQTELRKGDAYPLDRKLTINYAGTLGGLLDELEQRRTGIKFGFPNVLPMRTRYDRDTRTAVNVADGTVRTALIDAVPLKGYNWLVFEAITYDRDGSPDTEVHYIGEEPEKD